MAEKPILFNGDMVRAILEGRKTQTRRIIKPQPRIPTDIHDLEDGDVVIWRGAVCRMKSPRGMSRFSGELKAVDICPYTPGDVLWVRETWKSATGDPAGGGYALFDTYIYKADGRSKDDYPVDKLMVEGRWRPSIHMPRKAARIFLRVTDVRAERLQDITEDDVCKEGAEGIILHCQHMDWGATPPEPCFNTSPCADCVINYGFPELFWKMVWNPMIKPADLPHYGWDANPWVWVVEFGRIGGEEDGENGTDPTD